MNIHSCNVYGCALMSCTQDGIIVMPLVYVHVYIIIAPLVYTYMCTCVHTYMCTCVYTYMCTCVHYNNPMPFTCTRGMGMGWLRLVGSL